ncbi:MAG TPA: RNA polymerase sigma factor [Polyangiaceae bacterium]|jgi:RNA polymerase sigma-70 factor (ECF subfamily)
MTLSLDEGSGDPAAPAFFDEREDVPCGRSALEGMYPVLAPRVHRFQCDLLGDAALASDATQETFVRAFRRVGELPTGTRLAPWVFGIARHVSLELRRARGRIRRVLVPTDDGSHADVPDRTARSPEAQLLDREAVDVVARALDALSEDRRAVLLLRLDHGLSYDDIAGLMAWTLAKTKVEIFRAREVLRATLEEYRGGGS